MSLTLPRICALRWRVSRAAHEHDVAAHVGLRTEFDVAADDDDTIAHATVDAQRAADDDDGVGHFFVRGTWMLRPMAMREPVVR